MGIEPQYTLEHLLNGEKGIKDILTTGPRGLQIVPAASGIAEFSQLDTNQRRKLTANLKALEQHFDYLIIDTAAGIDTTVQEFVHSAHCAIVVISQEPTSLTDAFALLRVLKNKKDPGPIYVMVNRVENYEESAEIYKRFATAVRKYLQITPKYIGYVIDDKEVRKSIISQKPIVISKPHSAASRCLYTLANGIEKHFKLSPISNSFADYWQEQEVIPAPVEQAPNLPPRKFTQPNVSVNECKVKGPDLSDLIEILNRQIKTTDLSQHQVSHSINTLIDCFVSKFGSYPFEIEKIMTSMLSKDDYPKSTLRNLAQTIESLYEKRYQQTMRNSTDEMIHFLSKSTEAEEQYKKLAQILNRGYHRRFNKNLFSETANVHQTRPRIHPATKVKGKGRPISLKRLE